MKFYLLAALLLFSLSLSRGQDFEACYPDEIEAQNVTEQEVEEVSLDLESVINYFDVCVQMLASSEPTVRGLVRATSEVCTEFPIDQGEECSTGSQGSLRYGFDATRGECVEFKYYGCSGNENNFGTLEECWMMCEDPCQLPMDEGTSAIVSRGKDGSEQKVDCSENAGLYYYFDHTNGTCKPMKYQGCGGNKNRFESFEECVAICDGADSANATVKPAETTTTLPTTVTIGLEELPADPIFTKSRKRRSALLDAVSASGDATGLVPAEKDCDQVYDTNAPEFCNQFREKFPETAGIIDAMDRTTSADIDGQLIREFESQIKSASSTGAESRTQKLLLSLFNRPLKHTTVKIYSKADCRRIDITIRIYCVKAIFNRPTNDQKDKLCELVKQGIKRYWEVDLLNQDGTVNYPVNVKVVESLLLSKKVVLKWFDSVPNNPNLLRSFNLGFPWIPMWMKYKGFSAGPAEDESFAATAGHEFGHDVLKASGGLLWSWSHEGTSTPWGAIIPGTTPSSPPNPAPINLMWYYSGGDFSNYYNRLSATEDHVRDLIKYATWRFNIWWCPGAIGAPCLINAHCKPPGICSWFRCVSCNKDVQCAPDGYCRGIYSFWILNSCKPKKPNGSFCNRDSMCKSGMCDGGRCVECETDNHCPENHYCKYNNLPLITNKCTPKKDNGELCLQDRVCLSGYCDGGQCVECEHDNHCPSGQWCKNKNLPLILNQCVDKLPFGAWCLKDSQCQSDHCDGGRCGDCDVHSDCPPNQYCKWKNTPFVPNECRPKKCSGFCTNHAQCISGKCRWFGLCKRC